MGGRCWCAHLVSWLVLLFGAFEFELEVEGVGVFFEFFEDAGAGEAVFCGSFGFFGGGGVGGGVDGECDGGVVGGGPFADARGCAEFFEDAVVVGAEVEGVGDVACAFEEVGESGVVVVVDGFVEGVVVSRVRLCGRGC